MATTTNITEPPAFLRDYYAALAQRGMNLGNLGFTGYDQQRVAPWNEQQNAASQMIQTRAMEGSPAMDQAQSFFANTLAGGNQVGPVQSGGTLTPGTNPYSGANPFLENSINQAMGDVGSRIDSKFNGNAFGGTAHQQTLARELGNIQSGMRMQDYSTQQGLAENAVNRGMQAGQFNIGNANAMNQFNAGLQGQNIGRQQNMMSFAPTLAANDYADAQAMMGLGNQVQGQNQNIANANYEEFQRRQQYPGQQLSYMQAGLNPAASAFRNTTTNDPGQGSNPMASMIGGGMAGYGVGNYFGNPWLGAAVGAGAGLLGGR